MSVQVWKFPLAPRRDDWIEMPMGAELLFVAVKEGVPYVWARVQTDAPLRRRLIVNYGTGHHIDGSPAYIGSFMLDDGAPVFHAFDGGEDLAPSRAVLVPEDPAGIEANQGDGQ